MSGKFAAGIAGAAALTAIGLATAAVAIARGLLALPALPAVPVQELEIQAEAKATLEGLVRYRRHGRVLKLLRSLGAKVEAGDPILEFEDLALQASKADLDAEIAELRSTAADAVATRRQTASTGRRELRLATLRHLEEAYQIAGKDFERWKTLHAEGLVARLDYERKEREFADLEARLQAARASAADNEMDTVEGAEEPVPADLQRAERLRRRLDSLSASFVVRSPWDGTVSQFHVQEGQVPERGGPLASIERAARPLLVADVASAGTVVSVRTACGLPGPFPFTIRNGMLRMSVPAVARRPGDRCRLVVRARR